MLWYSHKMLAAKTEKAGALPTFFVIGAARAGTTSLHYYLSLHPQIQMSAIKEPHFFAGPPGAIPYAGKRVEDLTEYRRLFDPRVPVRGEASPSYTAHPRRLGVAARIKELVPDARLIYLVRDPIDRTVSHYLHAVAVEGERRDIADALGNFDPANLYLCASRYGTQLEQYLPHFPLERILVIENSDLRTARNATMRRIFAFLDVATEFESPDFAKEFRGSEAGRRYPPWYRAALDLGARTPLALLPVPLRRLLRTRVEGAVLPVLDEVTMDDVLSARLAECLGPEAARFRALTGLGTATWRL